MVPSLPFLPLNLPSCDQDLTGDGIKKPVALDGFRGCHFGRLSPGLSALSEVSRPEILWLCDGADFRRGQAFPFWSCFGWRDSAGKFTALQAFGLPDNVFHRRHPLFGRFFGSLQGFASPRHGSLLSARRLARAHQLGHRSLEGASGSQGAALRLRGVLDLLGSGGRLFSRGG